MKLLLARHGNTFDAGQTPYIVGCNEDLRLTAEGEAQAERLAALLHSENLFPSQIYCGELQRTRRTAELIGIPVIDKRLTELDYGAWSGLTTDEVRARFGAAEADAWDHNGIMPAGRDWQPELDKVMANIRSFADDAANAGGIALGVTSNGVLRFFAKLVDGLFEDLAAKRQMKVGTGNLCCLEYDGAAWQLGFWNRKP